MAKAFWRREPEPSRSEILAKELDESYLELQHAKKEFEKWKHSVNLYKERHSRIAKELEEEIKLQGD